MKRRVKVLPQGRIEIFCRYIRKKGKIIYPVRAKYFHFFVTRKKAA